MYWNKFNEICKIFLWKIVLRESKEGLNKWRKVYVYGLEDLVMKRFIFF